MNLGKLGLIITPSLLKLYGNIYPPFYGTGIRISKVSPDFRQIETKMKLKWYNRNFVGTHFGGNLFTMTDPFYMIMLIMNLGKDYLVWDKSTNIQFKKPGRAEVVANFEITDEQLEEIIENTKSGKPYLAQFHVDVKDTSQEVVACVDKIVYIKKKIQSNI